MVELADSFRRHGPAYRATCKDRLLPSPLAAMEAIAPCRTESLGGPLSPCTACGELEYRSHSGKNRHCPTCPKTATTPWVETQRARLLPVPSFLVTCTLPEARRPVARSHQRLMDHLLLQTSAAALQVLALDPTYLGGQVGVLGVLHTWTRALASHPPVPSLVPGGALSPDGSTGRPPHSADWLVPVHALSAIFRGTCKEALTTAGLRTHVPPQVWTTGWMTHGQPAGTGAEVLASCAPSIHRIAITHNRLEALENGSVTFRDKEPGSKEGTHRTLPAKAFIRRFLPHVLPKGFSQVRSDGFLSPSRRSSLAPIRTLLAACPSNDPATASGHNRERQATPPAPAEAWRCRQCGGQLVVLMRLSPTKRGPPS